MERSEKELRPYAEDFLRILEHWRWDVGVESVDSTLDDDSKFGTEQELERYCVQLRMQLAQDRLSVMKDRVGALEFGEEVFRDGLVDTEDGVYLASVMREARRELQARIDRIKRDGSETIVS